MTDVITAKVYARTKIVPYSDFYIGTTKSSLYKYIYRKRVDTWNVLKELCCKVLK